MSILLSRETLLLDANVSRYLSVVGLVWQLYDHLLTLPEEVALVWKAPPSYPKYAFLLNRYIVPSLLLVVAYANCGFSAVPFTDNVCRRMLITIAVFAVFSLGVANVLVLLRVVLLWENNQTVKRLMTTGFALSWCTTCGFVVATLLRLHDHMRFSHLVKMCVTRISTPALIGVWASPMAFEMLVLVSVCWNAVDRPTHSSIPLMRALQRDGIMFFLALTLLRAANLSLAATSRPELSLLLIFFVWSSTTLVLNRSLLSLQRAEAMDTLRVTINTMPRTDSPFGVPMGQLEDYVTHVDDVYDELESWNSMKLGRVISNNAHSYGSKMF